MLGRSQCWATHSISPRQRRDGIVRLAYGINAVATAVIATSILASPADRQGFSLKRAVARNSGAKRIVYALDGVGS